MKTDSIFYRLFQEFPSIFFELIGEPPQEANAYQFSSVEVKQTAFRIDGVFLPAQKRDIPLSVNQKVFPQRVIVEYFVAYNTFKYQICSPLDIVYIRITYVELVENY